MEAEGLNANARLPGPRFESIDDVLNAVGEKLEAEHGGLETHRSVDMSQHVGDPEFVRFGKACDSLKLLIDHGAGCFAMTTPGVQKLLDHRKRVHDEASLPRFERFLLRQSKVYGLTWRTVVEIATLLIAALALIISLVR